MKILGIDTSCDETSVALLDHGRIAANVVHSQTALHKPFGGVVPEIAARAHVERLIPALDEVLEGVEAVLVLRQRHIDARLGGRLR